MSTSVEKWGREQKEQSGLYKVCLLKSLYNRNNRAQGANIAMGARTVSKFWKYKTEGGCAVWLYKKGKMNLLNYIRISQTTVKWYKIW